MRTTSFVAMASLALTICTSPAFGQGKQDWERCVNDKNLYSGEAVIKSCSSIIARGKETNANLATAHLNRGLRYLGDQKFDLALSDFGKAISLDPKQNRAYISRGIVYQQKKEYDKALADFAYAISLKGDRLEIAYQMQGEVWAEIKEYDKALHAFSQSILLDPKRPEVFNSRGEAYELKSEPDFERALLDYNEAIKLDALHADAYLNRGDVYRKCGEYALAVTNYAKGTELKPGDHEYMQRLGLMRYAVGDFKNAATDFQKARILGDSMADILYVFLARERSGQSAVAELRSAMESVSTTSWPRSAIELFLGVKTPTEVLRFSTDAGTVCEAHFYIGMRHLLKSSPAEAETELKIAVDTCPKEYNVFYMARTELLRLLK